MSVSGQGTRGLVVRAGLSGAVGPAIAALTAPFVAHALAPSGRGALAAVLTPLTLADAVGSLGLPAAATYFIARGMPARVFYRRSRHFLLLSWVATMLVMGAIAGPVATHHGLSVIFVLAVWSTTGAALLFNLVRAARIAEEQWARINLERIFGPLLRATVLLALLGSGITSVEAVTWCYIVSGLAASLLLLRRRPSQEATSSDQLTDNASADVIRSFAGRSWATSLLFALNARVDQVLLIFLVSSSALGGYAVAVTIAELPNIVAVVVYRLTFSRSAKGQEWATTLLQCRGTAFGAFLVSIALYLASYVLIVPMFGPGFGVIRGYLPVLMLAIVLSCPITVLAGALTGRASPGLAARLQLVVVLTDAVLVIILAPMLGAAGAAIASLLSALIALGYGHRLLGRLNIDRRDRRLLLPRTDELRRLIRREVARSRETELSGAGINEDGVA